MSEFTKLFGQLWQWEIVLPAVNTLAMCWQHPTYLRDACQGRACGDEFVCGFSQLLLLLFGKDVRPSFWIVLVVFSTPYRGTFNVFGKFGEGL